jgi:uncharacterized membrane protein
MGLLAACLFIFGIIHINPAIPSWKAHAVSTFGKAYGAVYGVLSLVLLAACLWAYRQVEPFQLYAPPDIGIYAKFAILFIGFIFLGIFAFRGSWRNSIKYPMAIGISILALGHLLSNGSNRSTLLFGGLAIIAIVHAALRRSALPSVEREGHNLLSLFGGLALFGLAVQLHTVFAGVPVFQLLK